MDSTTESTGHSGVTKPQEAFDPPASKSMEVNDLIAPSLSRLTEGLPRKELEAMLTEAKECEAALEKEIKQLEEALQNKDTSNESAVSIMLSSEMTPPDRYYSVSALMGRLRDPLSTPLTPLNTVRQQRAQQAQQERIAQTMLPKKKKPYSPVPGDDTLRQIEKQKLLLSLDLYPEYRTVHPDSARLLAAWKRISSHRSAIVFRRPVNPKEAPGYQHRILFPIDLSLIRKMISAGMITSFADLHQRIGLICHNCVKFNGYLSDYAVVARDFESHVDDIFVQTVASVQPMTNSPAEVCPPEVPSVVAQEDVPPTNATTELRQLPTPVDNTPASS